MHIVYKYLSLLNMWLQRYCLMCEKVVVLMLAASPLRNILSLCTMLGIGFAHGEEPPGVKQGRGYPLFFVLYEYNSNKSNICIM